MTSLRIRNEFDLSTWLVCADVEQFNITVRAGKNSTLIIMPPFRTVGSISIYSLLIEPKHKIYESNKIHIDVVMDNVKEASFPDEDSSTTDASLDKEHEHYPYIQHAASVAMDYAERLIELIRWHTNQTWVGRGGHRSYHDLRQAWVPEGGRGALIGTGHRLIQGSTPVGGVLLGEDFKLLDEAIWRQVAQDLYSGTTSGLHDRLLLDAHYFLHGGNLLRCVLEAAIACEVYARKRVSDLATAPDDPVLKELTRSGSFVERYLHLAPSYLRSRSLKEEQPDLWRRVQELFQARNNAAHVAKLSDPNKSQGKIHLRTAHELVQWVSTL